MKMLSNVDFRTDNMLARPTTKSNFTQAPERYFLTKSTDVLVLWVIFKYIDKVFILLQVE